MRMYGIIQKPAIPKVIMHNAYQPIKFKWNLKSFLFIPREWRRAFVTKVTGFEPAPNLLYTTERTEYFAFVYKSAATKSPTKSRTTSRLVTER